jgi:DNA-3-methyladenine glycosylase I
MNRQHQAPWECIYAKEDKSDCKPGKKPGSDQEYFEILCLCILQAGLNWGVIRGNWKKYRKGFCGFSIHRVSKAQAGELLKNPNVLKNKIKVEAIIYNAKEFQRIKKEYGSFFGFLGSLRRMADEAVFKLLIRRFRHVGSYTAEYYLHSVGYRE